MLSTAGKDYGAAVVWKMNAEGTTLWALLGSGTLTGVAVDGANAVVGAGYFGSPATFGAVALTNAGIWDAVLWKVDAEGTTLWAVRGGGSGLDRLYAVAVDGVVGRCRSAVSKPALKAPMDSALETEIS